MQESTIGAAFLTQTLTVNDVTVKFEIWDTAGQERYHSLAPMYYRGAAAAVIVYDITNAVCTFLASFYWLHLCSGYKPFSVVVLLTLAACGVGNDPYLAHRPERMSTVGKLTHLGPTHVSLNCLDQLYEDTCKEAAVVLIDNTVIDEMS